MTYRFVFRKDSLVEKEIVNAMAGEECLVVFANKVNVFEPQGIVKEEDLSLLIKINDGLEKPFVQICTNMTADLEIDSKGGTLATIVEGGIWKIKAGTRARYEYEDLTDLEKKFCESLGTSLRKAPVEIARALSFLREEMESKEATFVDLDESQQGMCREFAKEKRIAPEKAAIILGFLPFKEDEQID